MESYQKNGIRATSADETVRPDYVDHPYNRALRRLNAENHVGREYGIDPLSPYTYRYMPPIGRLLIVIGEHCGVGGTIRPGNRQLAAWMGNTSCGHIPALLDRLAFDDRILYDPRTGLITLLCDPNDPLPDLQTTNSVFAAPHDQPHTPRRSAVVGFLYVMQSGKAYKIGCSTDVARRITQYSLPSKKLILTIPSADMYRDESALHAHFAARRINGEWFRLTAGDIQWLREVQL